MLSWKQEQWLLGWFWFAWLWTMGIIEGDTSLRYWLHKDWSKVTFLRSDLTSVLIYIWNISEYLVCISGQLKDLCLKRVEECDVSLVIQAYSVTPQWKAALSYSDQELSVNVVWLYLWCPWCTVKLFMWVPPYPLICNSCLCLMSSFSTFSSPIVLNSFSKHASFPSLLFFTILSLQITVFSPYMT